MNPLEARVTRPFLCPNIDQRGRTARRRIGRLVLGVGALSLVGGVVLQSPLLTGLGIVGAAGGAFSLFEARRGWCVVRAMGLDTPY